MGTLERIEERLASIENQLAALVAERVQEDLRLVSKETAAKLLELSQRTIDTMLTEGKLTRIKIGGVIRIPMDEIAAIKSGEKTIDTVCMIQR
jgi:excisionase family DNA binding protein